MKILFYSDTSHRAEIKALTESKKIETDVAEKFEAITTLSTDAHKALILDLTEFNSTVREFLDKLQSKAEQPGIPVLLIIDQDNTKQAREAKKAGRAEYLTKPFYPGELLYALHKLAPGIVPDKSAPIEKIIGKTESELFGRSEGIEEIREKIANIAKFPFYTVLIRGESGVGKQVVAKEIHRVSHPGGPFKERNMSAIPIHLLESELFGYEKGAFAGADKQKKSVFEQADGGTVFLDEIGDMEITHQAKILKVIEQKRVQHLGGEKDIPYETRIICATNKDLEQMVAEKTFRGDLFNRISKLVLTIPPLRERAEDIPALTFHCLYTIAAESNVNHISITFAGVESLARYNYPWNIRELENVLLRIVAENEEQITNRTIARCLPSVSSGVHEQKIGRADSSQVSAASEEMAGRFRTRLKGELLKQNYSEAVIEKTLDAYEGAVAETYPKDTPSNSVNIKNRCVFYSFWFYMVRGDEHIKKLITDSFTNISSNSIPNYTTQIYKTKLAEKWPYNDLYAALKHFARSAPPQRRIIPIISALLALLVLFTGGWVLLSNKNKERSEVKESIRLLRDNTIIGLAKEDEQNLAAELKSHFDGRDLDIRKGSSSPLVTLELRQERSAKGKNAELVITFYTSDDSEDDVKTVKATTTKYVLTGSGFSRADNRNHPGMLKLYQDNYNLPPIPLFSTPGKLSAARADALFANIPETATLYTRSEQDDMYQLAADADTGMIEELFYKQGAYRYRGSEFERELDFGISPRVDIEMVSGNWAVVLESLRLEAMDDEG